MKKFIIIAVVSAMLSSLIAQDSERSLLLSCSSKATPEIKQAFAKLESAVKTHALLSVLANNQPVTSGAFNEKYATANPKTLAYHHLLFVGEANDPLIQRVQQYEAKFDKENIYAFGFGAFTGDLGWIESGANPFLHSKDVKKLPYETELVVITGTTSAGVVNAIERFLDSNLINGLTAVKAKAKRTETTVFDREPCTEPIVLPQDITIKNDSWQLIGVTDCNIEVARGILDATSVEPTQVLALKYYQKGAWDNPEAAGIIANYLAGLHRAAYGNTLLVATFKNAQDAKLASEKLNSDKDIKALPKEVNKAKPDIMPVYIWNSQKNLFMSTIPPKELNKK